MKNFLMTVLSFSILIVSCKKEEKQNEEPTLTDFSSGIYTLNEGSFGNQNASISHISHSGELTSDPYFDANGISLGHVLQGFVVNGDRGYAVLNNSQKVEVIDMKTFEHIASITGLTYPRHMIIDNGNGYLTDGSMEGLVHVINLTTLEMEASIIVGNGPERLIKSGSKLYVCNSGGWLTDHTVSVIDLMTNDVITTIDVADRPLDIELDAEGNLWVLCSGETLYDENWNITGHTNAALCKLNAISNTMIAEYAIGEIGDHPMSMTISQGGDYLYLQNENLIKVDLSDLSEMDEIFYPGIFNTVDVDMSTGNLWLTSVPNFVTSSTVYEIGSSGNLLRQLEVGLGCNGVVVK